MNTNTQTEMCVSSASSIFRKGMEAGTPDKGEQTLSLGLHTKYCSQQEKPRGLVDLDDSRAEPRGTHAEHWQYCVTISLESLESNIR